MKVAIIGTAPGWELAPWGDPSVEKWGLNDGYARMGEYTSECARWFELHGDTPLTRARRPSDHFDRIRAMDIPVYYFHGEPLSPTAIRLDVEPLVTQGRDYFTCTNAYQIALALSLGATEIGLYGTPLVSNREVVVERPCVSYWIGQAEARGVRVIVKHHCAVGLMAHPYRYAFEDIEDRKASYDAAYSLFWSLAQWIPREDYRLTVLSQDPSDVALEISAAAVS
jgi:hypothetical protein